MRKICLLAMAVLLIIGFSGCGGNKQDQKATNTENQNKNGQKQEDQMDTVIDSFKDAMGSGDKLKCTYVVSQDGKQLKSEAFVEGDKYKSTTSFEGNISNVVFDGENTYTWTSQSSQGMKMDPECLDEMESPEQEQDETAEGEIHYKDPFDNAVDVKCEKVSSIDFSIPSNIDFVDQCEMLKNQQEQLQQMQQNLPQGFELPEGM